MNTTNTTTAITTEAPAMTAAAINSPESRFAALMTEARAAGNTIAVKRAAVESALGIAFDAYKAPFFDLMAALHALFVARTNKDADEIEKQREAFAALAKCFAFAGAFAVNGDLEDLYTTFRRVARAKDEKDAVGNIISRGMQQSCMISRETFRKRVEMHIGARLAGCSLRGGSEVVMTEDERAKMEKRIQKFKEKQDKAATEAKQAAAKKETDAKKQAAKNERKEKVSASAKRAAADKAASKEVAKMKAEASKATEARRMEKKETTAA